MPLIHPTSENTVYANFAEYPECELRGVGFLGSSLERIFPRASATIARRRDLDAPDEQIRSSHAPTAGIAASASTSRTNPNAMPP